jgi:hypothetical protein
VPRAGGGCPSSATARWARARLAVSPGDSIPKRFSSPRTPCCWGPCSTKSPAGWPGPVTCGSMGGSGWRLWRWRLHAGTGGWLPHCRSEPSKVRHMTWQQQAAQPSTHLWAHSSIGGLQRAVGQARQVRSDGSVEGSSPGGVDSVIKGARVGARRQPAQAQKGRGHLV